LLGERSRGCMREERWNYDVTVGKGYTCHCQLKSAGFGQKSIEGFTGIDRGRDNTDYLRDFQDLGE